MKPYTYARSLLEVAGQYNCVNHPPSPHDVRAYIGWIYEMRAIVFLYRALTRWNRAAFNAWWNEHVRSSVTQGAFRHWAKWIMLRTNDRGRVHYQIPEPNPRETKMIEGRVVIEQLLGLLEIDKEKRY